MSRGPGRFDIQDQRVAANAQVFLSDVVRWRAAYPQLEFRPKA
jgi:hypothetical protein